MAVTWAGHVISAKSLPDVVGVKVEVSDFSLSVGDDLATGVARRAVVENGLSTLSLLLGADINVDVRTVPVGRSDVNQEEDVATRT